MWGQDVGRAAWSKEFKRLRRPIIITEELSFEEKDSATSHEKTTAHVQEVFGADCRQTIVVETASINAPNYTGHADILHAVRFQVSVKASVMLSSHVEA
jgi:hypothetical protein